MNEKEKIHPEPEELEIKTEKELEEAKEKAGVIKEEKEIEYLKDLLEKEMEKPEHERDQKLIEKLKNIIANPEEWKKGGEVLLFIKEKMVPEIFEKMKSSIKIEISELIVDRLSKKFVVPKKLISLEEERRNLAMAYEKLEAKFFKSKKDKTKIEELKKRIKDIEEAIKYWKEINEDPHDTFEDFEKDKEANWSKYHDIQRLREEYMEEILKDPSKKEEIEKFAKEAVKLVSELYKIVYEDKIQEILKSDWNNSLKLEELEKLRDKKPDEVIDKRIATLIKFSLTGNRELYRKATTDGWFKFEETVPFGMDDNNFYKTTKFRKKEIIDFLSKVRKEFYPQFPKHFVSPEKLLDDYMRENKFIWNEKDGKYISLEK
jgi:hypothetical protein